MKIEKAHDNVSIVDKVEVGVQNSTEGKDKFVEEAMVVGFLKIISLIVLGKLLVKQNKVWLWR